MDIHGSVGNQAYVSSLLANHLLSNKDGEANLVFSPASILPVLGLIAAGSKGSTLDQLLTFLQSKNIEEINSLSFQIVAVVFANDSSLGGPCVSFANSIWFDRSLRLKPTFKEILDAVYKSAASDVDFQTKAVEVTKEVNQWAEKETKGFIKEILPSESLDFSTKLIFASAAYFKGAWEHAFDASKTKDDDFFLLDGSSVQVPFMTSKQKQYILSGSGFKVLKLPYEQRKDKRKFSMYFFLPDAKDGLPALVERIVSEPGLFENHIPPRQYDVGAFLIPKFKISFGFEVSKVLKELGLVSPFSGEGLTEIVDQKLYVSSIHHKSFIDVNEEGTVAADVTTVQSYVRSLSQEKLDFVADHPFLFVVREDTTGVLLFIGQILNPLSG